MTAPLPASRHTRSDDGARAAPAGHSGSGRAGDLSALIAKLEARHPDDRVMWCPTCLWAAVGSTLLSAGLDCSADTTHNSVKDCIAALRALAAA